MNSTMHRKLMKAWTRSKNRRMKLPALRGGTLRIATIGEPPSLDMMAAVLDVGDVAAKAQQGVDPKAWDINTWNS